MTSHELARKMLAGPDVPVAVGRDLGVYKADIEDFRIHPNGRTLLFNRDKPILGETRKQIFWISGPLI